MNEENYQYLSRQLQFLQFPTALAQELKTKMEQNAQAFVMNHTKKSNDGEASATLFFKKSDNSDKYFFNSYHINLKNENSPASIAQTFYIDNKKKPEGQENYKKEFTFNEAINLLAKADNKEEQRFVYGKWAKKTGELYNAWKGININEKDRNGNHEYLSFHDNYGFDIKKSISNLPIKESDKNNPDLIKSLQRGNLQPVKSENGNTLFLSANPPQRKINLYDKDMHLVNTVAKNVAQSQQSDNTPKNEMKAGQSPNPSKDESLGLSDNKKQSQKNQVGVTKKIIPATISKSVRNENQKKWRGNLTRQSQTNEIKYGNNISPKSIERPGRRNIRSAYALFTKIGRRCENWTGAF